VASSVDFDYTEFSALRQRMETAGDTVTLISLNDGLRMIARLFVPAKGTGPLVAETPKVTGKLRRSTFFEIAGSTDRQILRILQPARSLAGPTDPSHPSARPIAGGRLLWSLGARGVRAPRYQAGQGQGSPMVRCGG